MHKYNLTKGDKQLICSIDKLIVTAAFVFYLPYNIVGVLLKITKGIVTSSSTVWLHFALFASSSLLFCNSFVNAVIFLCMTSKANRFICKSIINARGTDDT